MALPSSHRLPNVSDKGLSKLSPCAPCWRVSLVEEGSTRIDVDESE
jgi:hypothetical protein